MWRHLVCRQDPEHVQAQPVPGHPPGRLPRVVLPDLQPDAAAAISETTGGPRVCALDQEAASRRAGETDSDEGVVDASRGYGT